MIKDVVNSETRTDMVRELLMYVLALLITTFLIRLLWNRSLVKYITILKPINTLSEAFVLSIALALYEAFKIQCTRYSLDPQGEPYKEIL